MREEFTDVESDLTKELEMLGKVVAYAPTLLRLMKRQTVE